MLDRFKKFFLPHKDNEHHPEIWKQKGALLFLGIIFFVEVVFLANSYFLIYSNKFLAAVFPEALVALTNDVRSKSELNTLTTNPVLTAAAQLKANDMAARGYFSHYTPEGNSPWTFFKAAGYSYNYAGENLAINFVDSKDVVDAWVKSPTHYANIIKDAYTEIGIATAEGEYKGRKTIFVVEFFGKPKSAPVQTPPTQVIVKETPKPVEPKTSTTTVVNVSTTTPVAFASTTVATTNSTTTASGTPEVFGLETENRDGATAETFLTYPTHINKILLLILIGIIIVLMCVSIKRYNKEHHGKILSAAIYFIFIALLVILFNEALSTGIVL